MVFECHHLAIGVYAAGEVVETTRSIEIMLHVVFARPQQFDRYADFFGDPRRFHHVVVAQPTTESATGTDHVHGDLIRLDAECAGHETAATLRCLRWRPDLALAVLEVCRAVLRLHRRVRDERIHIGRFHDLRRTGQRRVHVAVFSQRAMRRQEGEFGGLRGKSGAALRGRCPFVPRDHERLARLLCKPPAVPNNRHATEQAVQRRASIHDKGVRDAGHRFDGIEICGFYLAGIHGALEKRRVLHARHRYINSEHRLAGDDAAQIVSLLPRADNAELLRILQWHRGQIGRRHRCRCRGQRTICRGTRAAAVVHDALVGFQLADRHIPLFGRGRHQHRTTGSTHSAHRQPVGWRGCASAGDLCLVFRAVEIALFDAHIRPVDIEFFGDEHRQHGLDALSDFRILRRDGHDTVGRDAHIRAEHRVGERVRGAEAFDRFKRFGITGQQQSAADERRDSEKIAAIDGECGVGLGGHGRLLSVGRWNRACRRWHPKQESARQP